MDKISTYHLRLERVENDLQHMFKQSQETETHSEKVGLLVAKCRDLYNVKIAFKKDHLQLELLAIGDEVLDVGVHREKLNKLDNVYFLSPHKQVAISVNNRLQQIKLPTFSGNVHMWFSFSNLFTVLVVEKKELTRVEPLFYLKSALEGEPASQIQSLTLTQGNF
ncbi:hypothetical protein PR048_032858 [Dryococelus australis]|uniref:Uncharacterized protein n=1 Tax=Dryococelus australis TaxID=614101 RepID=A0ABQ9G683_9NEOP|nr:hypothetical protein PR048_032858 [Dryococelus australis]